MAHKLDVPVVKPVLNVLSLKHLMDSVAEKDTKEERVKKRKVT